MDVRIPEEKYKIIKQFLSTLDEANHKDQEEFGRIFKQFKQGIRDILEESGGDDLELPRILDL